MKRFTDAITVLPLKTSKAIKSITPFLFVFGMITLFGVIQYNTDDVKVGDVYAFMPTVEFESDVQRNKETETIIKITEISIDGDQARYVFLTLQGKPYTLDEENTISVSFLDKMYEKRLSATE